jgi:DNA (cytosine-5)-methyltransferase 1
VTKIDGADYTGITLLSGGSPCQDLSVAGKRAGLTGSRSSLFHEQCRIWRESGAPYLLWENVLGALSSNNGADFATVLSTIVGSAVAVPADGWRGGGGVVAGRDAVAAWRVLDLQHFGPPQRRVRVFVLAARASGVDPAEVLALSEGVCGHPSPRQQSREVAASGTRGSVESCVALNISNSVPSLDDTMGTLDTDGASTTAIGAQTRGVVFAFDSYNQAASHVTATLSHGESGRPIAFHMTQDPISGEVSPAIGRTTDGMGVLCTTGDITPFKSMAGGQFVSGTLTSAYGTKWNGNGSALTGDLWVTTTGDITHALTHEGADASEDGTGRGTPIVARMVAFGEYTEDGMEGAIKARDYKDATDLVYAKSGRPRRLTPLECERLMSWPDQWTATGRKEDGTTYQLSDTARYRLCGNGVGSVCAEWIAKRLMEAIQ